MKRDHRYLCICIGLVLITSAVYGKAVGHDFINMDDPFFTREHNVPAGLTPANIKNAFTTLDCIWFPLTWLSHMTDAQLYGLRPAGHHVTSILLHIINVLLLFAVFRYMTGAVWKSAVVAALFAVHPVNVETVAYISARKELLCALFWILGMAAYTRYTKNSTAGRYGLVVLAFVLGAMTNPIILVFPIVCLLIDLWPLERSEETPLRRLVMEKLPLLVLALGFGILALCTQQKAGAMPTLEMLPMSARLGNTTCAYAAYLGNLVYPAGLAVYYPYAETFPLWKTLGALFMLLALTGAVLYYQRRLPFLTTGWFWFLLTLAPGIGIVKAGGHAMADRYAYISFIGLFIIIAWGGGMLIKRLRIKPVHAAAGVMGILLAMGILAFRQLDYWQNSITVFRHTVAVTDNNPIAHNNLGKALADKGNIDAARRHFEQALAIFSAFPEAHNNLGVLLNSRDQQEQAIKHFEKAVQLAPDLVEPRYNLGRALLARGRLDEAAVQFQEILQMAPGHLKATTRLALVYTTRKEYDKAIGLFTELLERRPAYSATIAYNLACIYAIKNDKNNAIAWLKKSIKNGFSRFDLLFSDKDLENISDTPYYKTLLKRYGP
ncbi:MAG: tetratricopeptide repeat protein [Thermodesulfobacteriota bacterium]|nr:tetratricopeptide repeat protein [Thermodesulfobacteriota bacterium]